MKKVWKWVIGIVIGLIVLAVLVGVGFLVWGNLHVYRNVAQLNRGFSQRGPGMMPYGGFGYQLRGPGMMGYRMIPFGGFFGGLLMLGFLVLIVLGIIWLVGRARTSTPIQSTAAVPAVNSEPIPAAVLNPCKKCGRPLQADWTVCPYCGKKV
ncbi:MAG: hypothetical protein ABSG01_09655 [Anaerolineales bacterium]|jgi:hypothetical protein